MKGGKSKNSAESLLKKILELEPVQFIGVCKVIGVEIYREKSEVVDEDGAEVVKSKIEPKDFFEIWNEVCDVVGGMNRVRRKNLGKLVYAATKKEKTNGNKSTL